VICVFFYFFLFLFGKKEKEKNQLPFSLESIETTFLSQF